MIFESQQLIQIKEQILCSPTMQAKQKHVCAMEVVSISTRWNGESAVPHAVFLKLGRCGKAKGGGS